MIAKVIFPEEKPALADRQEQVYETITFTL